MKLQLRLTSFLLCLVIMITGLAGYIPGLASDALLNENQSIADIQGKSETLADSTIVDSNIAVGGTAQVGSEKILLPDIVKEDINASQFIGRSPAKETNLNTFVFKNQDGTQTMKVYSHPVKYIDEIGGIQDISTDIQVNKDGTFETKANSIKTTFSKVLKDGITLKHDMVNIRLVSDKLSDAKLSEDNKIVSYVYDDKTTLEYSLTYTGFKEDIVVKEYTGQTEYEFTLHTNGLTLVKENGSYFLKDSKNNIKATIGDIIIFTADERNNTFGDMTHETITANQEYVITIHVDSAYLKDSKTKYPIRIDPTIEINYDEDGAGAIEDVTLNQNTTYSGTSGSLYVGRSTDGSLNRVLMRFPNLNLEGIDATQINNANVEIRDIMCQSDEDMVIECYSCLPSAPSWTESSTISWSGMGDTFYHPTVLDAHEVSYGQGNATGSGSSHRYRFDISFVVYGWTSGIESPEKGIVFKATNEFENQTGDNVQYWKKTFASYNRSSNKPSLSISYSTILSLLESETSVAEGKVVSLYAFTNPQRPVTWTSSNQEIAIVDSNGFVTGIKAGTAVITASITEDGRTISDTCTVYVTIENGVYYIKNMNSNKYLHVENGGINNLTDVQQYHKYIDAVSNNDKVRQLWKICYLGNRRYSIRPMSKLDKGLDVTNGNVDIYSISSSDTLSNIPSYCRWTIEWNSTGYVFKNDGSDSKTMQIENASTTTSATVIASENSNDNNCKWALIKISFPPSGAFLYDLSTNMVATSKTTRFVDAGMSKSLNTLQLGAVGFSGTSNNQTFLWHSSNSDIATVDANGKVSGVSAGKTTIIGSICLDGVYYNVNYTIWVSLPSLFISLIEGNMLPSDTIYYTDDGLVITTTSLSTVLTNKGMFTLPINSSYTKEWVIYNYFDDWYLFSVDNGTSVAYGLYKMREQEYDHPYEEDPSDQDSPGVAISFVELNTTILTNCLDNPTNANKYALQQDLIKVVGPGLYEENDIIADYFANTSSDGPYLIAEKYISFIANGFSGNIIDAPEGMSSILDNNERIENALTDINEAAEIDIFDFDECTITVQDKDNLTIYEKQAILSCYTANVTFNSFAAEVEFHADMVKCLSLDEFGEILVDMNVLMTIFTGNPITGIAAVVEAVQREDWYEAALRADMGISEEGESGFGDYYYNLNSNIVQNQAQIHGEY